MKKRLTLLLAILLFLTACAGEPIAESETQPTPEKQTAAPGPAIEDASDYESFTMLGLAGDSNRQPQQDVLTPLWRERTGVQMQVETIPGFESYEEYLKTAIEEATLPDVLAIADVLCVPQRRQLLMKNGVLKPIDYETAKEAMPLTAQRLADMGISFEDWFYANADPEGLWYAVPQLPSPLYEESVRQTRFGVDQTPLELSYFWVRDDWLTAINNYAAEEMTFVRLYEVFADNMTIEYVCDFWPNSLEDWTRFFKDVEDFAYANFQVIKPVLPTYGDSVGSVVWSLYGASGLKWEDLLAEFPDDMRSGGENFAYYADTQGWETYIRWLNTCVNEGYTDLNYTIKANMPRPELYVDQYAVLNQWVTPSRGTSTITGNPFGWRYYPVLTESVVGELQDNAYTYLSLATDSAVGFNAASVDADQLKTLLGWVDWNYSLEAAMARQWGVGLSEGEGETQRFAYEYSDVAQAMLGDDARLDAAWQYGLVNVLSNQTSYWNHEVYGVGGEATAQHPFYVYPLTQIPYDQQYFVTYVVKQYLLNLVLDMQYIQVADEIGYREAMAELQTTLESFKQSFAKEVTLSQQQALSKAIMASPDAFDEAYEAYLAVYDQSETKQTYEAQIRALLAQIHAAIWGQ